MAYFTSKEIAAIAISASLWAILNWLITPIFWELTHLPILCDMVGVSLLILTVWWIRKLGAASTMGTIATMLNFLLRPGAVHFLGFTVASIAFDISTRLTGYRNFLNRRLISYIAVLAISFISTLIAGFIIGNLFMSHVYLLNMYGGVLFFTILHGAGGIIGGIIGIIIMRSLEARRITP
ncbi:hypothetical protein KEJ47_09350 [Candidatus Bathyarchaeota archaeon]|nr:hypothetical protein [Candidatus Bathyarchaeota archaeon]